MVYLGVRRCVFTKFTEGEWFSFECDGVDLVIFFWWTSSAFSSFGVGGRPNSFSYKNDMPTCH